MTDSFLKRIVGRWKRDRDAAAARTWAAGEVKLMDEAELRKQGYIAIRKFCGAMDTWAQVCQRELPTDSEYRRRWREEFGEHWEFIRLAIAKSCLLDRLIYGGERLRENICPIHEGHWSGCNLEDKACDCAHDSCITGWLQNPGDPKSQASFKVTLLKPSLGLEIE